MIQKLSKLSDEAFLVKLIDRYDNLKGAFELVNIPEYQFLKRQLICLSLGMQMKHNA